MLSVIRLLLAIAATAMLALSSTAVADELEAAVAGDARGEQSRERDSYRNPLETLKFFGIRRDMTVVEIWPGGGWYTEILAPYLRQEGRLYAAHYPEDVETDYRQRSRRQFEQKLAAEPEHYSEVRLVDFDPGRGILDVPQNSADRILTFRNVHSWLRGDSEQQAFELFYHVLKPGGILGLVQHSSRLEDMDRATMAETGYLDEDFVVALARNAGFELVASSDINANPRDTTSHEAGVWTLPPTLRLGDEMRVYYESVGESNRMTLKFRKPTVDTGEENGNGDDD